VPPSLRTAQKSFTDAIQTQVPDLAGTIVEMRALEERITQVRTNLGIDNSKGASTDT
jgi:2-oxo-4-hydroxy-4-carboxy--5-ureidoimidazoline (OHCU) decarboxylase